MKILYGALTLIAIYLGVQYFVFSSWLKDGVVGVKKHASSSLAPKGGVNQAALPGVLQNYLKKVILKSDSSSAGAMIEQSGRFWTYPGSPGVAFKAKQWNGFGAASFSWIADMQVQSVRWGFPIVVCDRLIEGVPALRAQLMSVVPLVKGSGPNLLKGQILRYLAEIPWFPQVILKNPSIRWIELDANRVEARLLVGGDEGRVEFTFNKDGLIEKAYAKEREFRYGGQFELRPWEGVFSSYQDFGDVKLPAHGEVSWLLDTGVFTYFKGDIISVSNF